jgi:hypothetical protein
MSTAAGGGFEVTNYGPERAALLSIERIEAMGHIAVDTKHETQQVEIIDYGRISEINWPGAVSAQKLIEGGEFSAALVGEAIRRLNEFYVGVNPLALTRCIDGRHDPKLDENHLGPQVPGGALGAALAHKISVDTDSLMKGSFLTDADHMIGTFIRLGLTPAGHRDKASEGKSKVGCGMVDCMDILPATMVDPDLIDDHKRVVGDIMKPIGFNRNIYLQNVGAAAVLNGRRQDYFRGKETIIDTLESRTSKKMPVLEGEHKECLFIVNFVPGTTMSSNRFADKFEGMQAFGYDLWRSIEMAGKIMPTPQEADDRERFITARVMTTIATLMALTDGSQRLVIRKPASPLESLPQA